MAETLDDLCKSFDDFLEKFGENRYELVEQAGVKMCKKVLRNIEASTKEHTGNLKKAVYIATGSKGGYAAVRNDHKKAPHAHLVEFGHDLYKGAEKKVNKYGRETNIPRSGRKLEGQVNGKFMYRNAINELEDELTQDAEKIIDKTLKEAGFA